MSREYHSRYGFLLASLIVAAALGFIAAPTAPSYASIGLGADCQAGPESLCCTCGEIEGRYYCHPSAETGGVVCRDDGYCPISQPICYVPGFE